MAIRTHLQPRRQRTVSETELEDRAADARGDQLHQARSADAAWRARQARKYQKWIDRAHAWEQEGHRWVQTPEENVGYAVMWTAVGGAPLALGNTNPRLLLFLGVMFGVLILLRPTLGGGVHGLARLARRFWLRSARRANVEVTDPGNIPLLGPGEVRPSETPE